MHKIILLILSFCLIPFSVLANEAEKVDVLANAMLPLVFDVNQYTKAESTEQLSKQLNELRLAFQQTTSHRILDYLEQTQKNIEQKNEPKARELTKAILAFCLASHPKSESESESANKTAGLMSIRFASGFELAEYHYITQNYQAAITCYDHYLTGKKQPKSKEQTKLALDRLLNIYTQIEKDPSIAAAYLNEYDEYIAEYPDLKLTLGQWVQDLNSLHTEELLTFAKIQDYVSYYLNAQNIAPQTDKVKRAVLKGMIFNHLNEATPNEKEKPLLLDWLALCYEP